MNAPCTKHLIVLHSSIFINFTFFYFLSTYLYCYFLITSCCLMFFKVWFFFPLELNLYISLKALSSTIQVLSVTLDDWSDDEVDAMVEVGGNSSANAIYEAFIPGGYSKPGPDSSHEERVRFIRSLFAYIYLRIILLFDLLRVLCLLRVQISFLLVSLYILLVKLC